MSIVPIVHPYKQIWQSVKNTHNLWLTPTIRLVGNCNSHQEVNLIGIHIVSKFQPNPTIITKFINNFCTRQLLSRPFPFKTIVQQNCIKIKSYRNSLSRPLHFSLFPAQWQDSSSSNWPTFHWPSEDQQDSIQGVAESHHPHIESVQHPQGKMVCKHHGFPGHQRLQAMAASWDIHKGQEETPRKHVPSLCWHSRSLNIPLELHWWNVQWHQTGWTRNHWSARSIHQDFRLRRCSYTSPEEKMQHWLELLFHATKHFKVKKWVRSQTALNETVTFNKLLQHAKQHETTIKDFQWHKFNGGVATSTTINKIRTFKQRKG